MERKRLKVFRIKGLDLLTNTLKLTSCEDYGWDDSLAFSPLLSTTRPDLENAPDLIFNAINGLASFFGDAPINREYTPINWRAI